MIRVGALFALALSLISCDDDGISGDGNGSGASCYDGACATRDIPFSDAIDAPTLTDVTLECQSLSIVVLATATDPQGSSNLQDVIQTIGVFPNVECQGAQIIVQDDFAGSGVEESFGDAFLAAANQALYDQICACDSWPVQVQLEDADGNVTSGRVVARVTR